MLNGLAEFADLVAFARNELAAQEVVNGWRVDRWALSDDSLDALCNLYRAVITGNIDDEILAALVADGVDVDALFYDEDDSDVRNRTTRADLCELAAAAAWVAIDDWPLATLHMPNVPKSSRDRSESGLDVLSLALTQDGSTPLADGDALFIGSVKHTVSDVGDLRRKLVRSISPSELTQPYLMQQLRVFVGRLAERGIAAQRAFLFINEDLHTSARVSIALTAAADVKLQSDLRSQIDELPHASATRTCRLLLLSNIAGLHQVVAADD